MNKTILIDLDGVLADFPTALFRHFGKDYDCEHCKKHGEDWMLELAGSQGRIAGFWNGTACDVAFWAEIPVLPDAEEVLAICSKFTDRIGFLSSGACKPAAYAGKMHWVLEHFPKYRKRLFVGSDKELFGSSDIVLVDDWMKNVKAFREEGGHGILLPRPWNEEHHLDSLLALKSRLGAIFNR